VFVSVKMLPPVSKIWAKKLLTIAFVVYGSMFLFLTTVMDY
jgi:hypothetical protein